MTLTPSSSSQEIRAAVVEIARLDPLELEKALRTIRDQTKQPLALLRKIAASSHIVVTKQVAPAWTSLIRCNARGEPIGDAANVLIALRNDPAWKGRIVFDEFRQRPMILEKPPWANGHWRGPAPFTDADEANVLVWVQTAGISCRIEAVRQALSIICDENRYHPVREYLDAIAWDGKPRIDNWLTYYLGVEPIPNYTSVVGAMWLISGIARIYQPGCLAKYCLILEGEQDLKKSTALEVLGSPWFTDDVAEMGSKDSSMQVGNAWIVELAELDSVRKAHISAIKAFISRRTDRFRKPFGRYIIEQERQCILAGTVNPSGSYLTDDTGAVRFWPNLCTAIDIPALTADRDQLWAEAKTRYEGGCHWWPTDPEAIFAAQVEQEARFDADSWEGKISRWVNANVHVEKITVDDILVTCFDIQPRDHTKSQQTRVGSILKRRLKLIPQRSGLERWFVRP